MSIVSQEAYQDLSQKYADAQQTIRIMTKQAGKTAALLTALNAYQKTAGKFIAKVESGQARSHTTYTELKAAKELADKALASDTPDPNNGM